MKKFRFRLQALWRLRARRQRMAELDQARAAATLLHLGQIRAAYAQQLASMAPLSPGVCTPALCLVTARQAFAIQDRLDQCQVQIREALTEYARAEEERKQRTIQKEILEIMRRQQRRLHDKKARRAAWTDLLDWIVRRYDAPRDL
ncbi:MAG: hypothetical protein C4296_00600 [Gemmataceae bacterium]